jgi:hypothetical protein
MIPQYFIRGIAMTQIASRVRTIQVRPSRNPRWQRQGGWEVYEVGGVSLVYRDERRAILCPLLSYIFYPFHDRGPLLVFQGGDAYQIHRCLTVLDQPGRGKGDLCGVDPHHPDASHPINLVTGTPFWTHELVEPSFSWNNVYTLTNTAWGFGSQFPQCIQGRDFYNLGRGFPPNSTPSQVSAILTTAINGVPYKTTFTYPHPYALIP